MKIGYSRASIREQECYLKGKHAALEAEGCERMFEDRISGAQGTTSGLREALFHARTDDVLVAARLDRCGLSLLDALRTEQKLTEAASASGSSTSSSTPARLQDGSC